MPYVPRLVLSAIVTLLVTTVLMIVVRMPARSEPLNLASYQWPPATVDNAARIQQMLPAQRYDAARHNPLARTEVVFPSLPAGVIVISTRFRRLYLGLGNGKALRYAIGVGRQGMGWSGTVTVGAKKEWPGWTPPAEMLRRRPDLPRYMPGGIANPLGARALYLFSGGSDTLFRIHGTNEPETIGQAVSSGCFRMMNRDVEDLYARVEVGTQVVVQR